MSKVTAVQGAVLSWDEWRKAGKSPKTREAALRIVSHHLGLDLSRVKESLARNVKSLSGDEIGINDRLSLMVWDIQENGAALIDYSQSIDRIFYDLLYQAGQLIGRYMRVRVPMARVLSAANAQTNSLINVEAPHIKKESRISVPMFVKTAEGHKNVKDVKPTQLEDLAQNFIEYALRAILRWKYLGADAAFVRRTLARAQEKILAEFVE
jgi:hypothetical protein